MKRLIPLIIFAILLLFHVQNLWAQSPATTDMIAQANQHYEASQFSEAAKIYQSLVDSGLDDGTLYYNLGNAYFKQEDWGNAILNYRRAQRITPRDPDIRANLILARAQTVDQIETDSQVLVGQILKLPEQWLTLNEMALVSLGLWFLLVLLVIVFTRLNSEAGKQRLAYLMVVVGFFLVVGIFSMGARLYVEAARPDGIIIVEGIDVTSGPGEQYIVEFTLHSGTEISILEERPNWTRVTLPGGQLQGWVPTWAVTPITS